MFNIVGLFGTCGNSKWRDSVIPVLEANGIEYFNPVILDWNEECMKNEVLHASLDRVILLVITGETTGIASMAESGWIAAQAILRGQCLIMVIEDVDPSLDSNELRINKTRALMRKYILSLPKESGVYLFDNINDAVEQVVLEML